jgi:hypothetical protein
MAKEPEDPVPGDEASFTADRAPCPFCGVDAVDPDKEYGDTCAHLVAQWAMDPYDDGGGVAAELSEYSDALGLGRELGLACRELLVFIIDGQDEVGIEKQITRLRAAIALTGQPGWWSEVESYTIDNWASTDTVPNDEPAFLGGMASPIVWSLASEMPDIRQTGALLGGMTSGDFNFVWSLDRIAAARRLNDAIVGATAALRKVIAAARSTP